MAPTYCLLRLLHAVVLAIMTLNLQFTTAMPVRRDCTTLGPVAISARQTTTTIGALLSQSMPCIPTSVDTTMLQATVASLQAPAAAASSNAKVLSFGSWLTKTIKSAWDDVKSSLVSVLVEDLVDWTGVGEWVALVLEGWKLVTSADHKSIVATSADGKSVKQFVVKQPVPVKVVKEAPCGGSTHKMCP